MLAHLGAELAGLLRQLGGDSSHALENPVGSPGVALELSPEFKESLVKLKIEILAAAIALRHSLLLLGEYGSGTHQRARPQARLPSGVSMAWQSHVGSSAAQVASFSAVGWTRPSSLEALRRQASRSALVGRHSHSFSESWRHWP